MSDLLPNAYITKNAIFIGGEKVPGVLQNDPVLYPKTRGCNVLTVNFLVSNVVVEGDDE
jgi:hypothetical protein